MSNVKNYKEQAGSGNDNRLILEGTVILKGSELSVTGQQINDAVAASGGGVTKQLLDTGVLEGGSLTINSGDNTKVDLSAGFARIVDNYTNPLEPEVVEISWQETTGISLDFLLTDPLTRFKIDATGALLQQTDVITDDDYRDFAVIGNALHQNQTFITATVPTVFIPIGYFELLQFIEIFGGQNISGNQYQPNGANLLLDKASGESWRLGGNYNGDSKNPNVIQDAAQTAIQIIQSYQNAAGDALDFNLNAAIDPTVYDDGTGTLNSFAGSSNQATLRHIYYFPATGATVVRVGTKVYQTLDDAIAGAGSEMPFVTSDFNTQGFVRTVLAVTKGCIDLTNNLEAVFIQRNEVRLR